VALPHVGDAVKVARCASLAHPQMSGERVAVMDASMGGTFVRIIPKGPIDLKSMDASMGGTFVRIIPKGPIDLKSFKKPVWAA
jgi:hypothetical protein